MTLQDDPISPSAAGQQHPEAAVHEAERLHRDREAWARGPGAPNLDGLDAREIPDFEPEPPERERVRILRTTTEAKWGDWSVQSIGEMPDPGPLAPLLLGMLEPDGATVLFGTGGVGKGALAAWTAVELARLGHRVLIIDFEGNSVEWRGRVHSLALDVVDGIMLWDACRDLPGAIWTVTSRLTAMVKELDITYVIVDSANSACVGTKTEDSDVPGRYFRALAAVGVPSLTIAHTTKASDQTGSYPFGSVFWHNFARLTWHARSNSQGVVLTNRKANRYRRLGTRLVVPEWRSDRLVSVSVTVQTTKAGTSAMELAAARALNRPEVEWWSVADLATAAGVTETAIGKALTRDAGSRLPHWDRKREHGHDNDPYIYRLLIRDDE